MSVCVWEGHAVWLVVLLCSCPCRYVRLYDVSWVMGHGSGGAREEVLAHLCRTAGRFFRVDEVGFGRHLPPVGRKTVTSLDPFIMK